MKRITFVSALAGLMTLAATLTPINASALTVGSMTMDGAYSTDGNFSVIVYEDTGADTVTGAGVSLSFSQPVTNLSYDYNVGPFKAVDYDGAHNAYGTVTGRNPLARVSFTLASPGTVVADVAAAGSYLWHVDGASVQDFAFEKGQAYFTYTPPEPKPIVARTSTPAATPAPAVADTPAPLAPAATEQTKKPTTDAKEVGNSHAGLVTSSVSTLIILAAAAAYWFLIHNKATEVAPAKAYKLGQATAASKHKPAKKKPSVRKSAATKKK